MAMKPVVNRLEEEFGDRVEFRALNIDEASSKEAMAKYKFVGQPQFVIVAPNGEVVASRNGMQTYDRLKADIEAALAKR
ncbi:MAG: thioredoxin family protein [Candidatus Brachytrichaceae bacterium NZ_4S206]|jgi:thiol-disulfide isomerase/thioredoxin